MHDLIYMKGYWIQLLSFVNSILVLIFLLKYNRLILS